MKRKILCILCVLAIALGLFACSRPGTQGGQGGGSTVQSGENQSPSSGPGSADGPDGAADGEDTEQQNKLAELAERREYLSQFRGRIFAYDLSFPAAVKDDGTLLYPDDSELLEDKGLSEKKSEMDALHDAKELKGDVSVSGLRKDGSMFRITANDYPSDAPFPKMTDWRFEWLSVVGVKTDGTIFIDDEREIPILKDDHGDGYVGMDNDVRDWQNVESILSFSYGDHRFGLRKDGTVCHTTPIKAYQDAKLYSDVADWTNIVQLTLQEPGPAGTSCLAGLRADGTVVISEPDETFGAEWDEEGILSEIESWQDIVAITMHPSGLVGLKADGSVLYAGDELHPAAACANWKDIIAISGASDYVMGLKADGTVLTTLEGNPTADWNIFE